MPITHSAAKKLHQDEKRRLVNRRTLAEVKTAVRNARLKPTAQTLTKAYSVLDVAAKKHVIHHNRAARLKSRLSHNQPKTQKSKRKTAT